MKPGAWGGEDHAGTGIPIYPVLDEKKTQSRTPPPGARERQRADRAPTSRRVLESGRSKSCIAASRQRAPLQDSSPSPGKNEKVREQLGQGRNARATRRQGRDRLHRPIDEIDDRDDLVLTKPAVTSSEVLASGARWAIVNHPGQESRNRITCWRTARQSRSTNLATPPTSSRRCSRIEHKLEKLKAERDGGSQNRRAGIRRR